MNKLAEHIKELSFPKSGDYFAVSSLITLGNGMIDRSYRGSVFQCLESDATRIVCREVKENGYDNKPIIFHRSDWRIDNINHLLPSLGFSMIHKSK